MDLLEKIKIAFGKDNTARKNIALRLAYDEIERLRAAQAGARVGAGWQPISTAPAHPTHFLMWLPSDDELGYFPTVQVGYRMRTSGEIQTVGFSAQMDDGIEPTHWTPMLEPPSEVRADVGAGADLATPPA